MTTTSENQTSQESFANRLRRLREERGLTQHEVSKSSGLSQSTISALETGKQRPWPTTRRALARAFEMSIEELDRRTIASEAADVEVASTRSLVTALSNAPRSEASEAVLRLLTKLNALEDRFDRVQQELGLIRRVIDLVPVLIWTTDVSGTITSATGWADLRYRDWNQSVGGRITDSGPTGRNGFVLPVDVHERALTGQTSTASITWAGRTVDLVVEPMFDGSGRLLGTIGVAVDASGRIPPSGSR